jgi:type VI secretion system protein ImpA
MDCPDDQLPASAAMLADAHEHAQAIIALLREKLGPLSPDMGHLSSDIEELKRFVDAQLVRRFPDRLKESAAAEAAAQDSDGNSRSPAPQWAYGKIADHDDVIRRLDEICEYYERIEPSSPLPVLLRRARSLVGKSFAEVLKNVAPGGLPDFQTLSGPDTE